MRDYKQFTLPGDKPKFSNTRFSGGVSNLRGERGVMTSNSTNSRRDYVDKDLYKRYKDTNSDTKDNAKRRYERANEVIDDMISGTEETFQKVREDLRDRYKVDDRTDQLGRLRERTAETEELLNKLPQNIANRTSGRLITASSLNKLQGKESGEIKSQVGNLRNITSSEQSGVNLARDAVREGFGQFRDEFYDTYRDLSRQRDNAFDLYLQRGRERRVERSRQLRRNKLEFARRRQQRQRDYNRKMLERQKRSVKEIRNRYIISEYSKTLPARLGFR